VQGEEDLVPVVETGAAQIAIIDGEAERLDELQPAPGDRAQPSDVSGVGRYLRGDQNQVQRGIDGAERHEKCF